MAILVKAEAIERLASRLKKAKASPRYGYPTDPRVHPVLKRLDRDVIVMALKYLAVTRGDVYIDEE